MLALDNFVSISVENLINNLLILKGGGESAGGASNPSPHVYTAYASITPDSAG